MLLISSVEIEKYGVFVVKVDRCVSNLMLVIIGNGDNIILLSI